MFPISRPTGQNLRRLQLFSAQKKKKKSRRPTLFNDSGFYQKSKPFRYENLSTPIFGYFRSLTLRSRTTTWLLCSVLTRPSTLVAIYFDKCSHIPASNVIKALRHNVPLSLLYEDGHPRCKGFRFGVKCAVRRKSGQKKKKYLPIPIFQGKKKKKKKKPTYQPYAKFMMKSETYQFFFLGLKCMPRCKKINGQNLIGSRSK